MSGRWGGLGEQEKKGELTNRGPAERGGTKQGGRERGREMGKKGEEIDR